LPDEEDKKEVKLKEMTVIAEVSREMEDTLRKTVEGRGWEDDGLGSLKDSRNVVLAASADLNVRK
jgi:hypothetical protein